MAFPGPGPGRPKGSKGKRTRELEARLARLGCDPLEGMALIAMGKCPCPTCDGSLRPRYTVGAVGPYLDPDKGQEMTCRTCWGTGREPIAPELRGRMFSELAQYVAPKRKAVEHSSEDGTIPRFVMIGAQEDASAEEWERRVNGEREDKPQ